MSAKLGVLADQGPIGMLVSSSSAFFAATAVTSGTIISDPMEDDPWMPFDPARDAPVDDVPDDETGHEQAGIGPTRNKRRKKHEKLVLSLTEVALPLWRELQALTRG